jgi:hypothetical protein
LSLGAVRLTANAPSGPCTTTTRSACTSIKS